MLSDKMIGLALAISSSLAIGTSFIITKKGLIDAAERHSGYSSESYSYLKNATWWAGMATMVVGELANFAAYTFAPAILVVPLGALSVLIGAILASIFLQEHLGKMGKVGCVLCLVGTIIIVLHAPEDKDVQTVDEILDYALQPAFMLYTVSALLACLFLKYRLAPIYGTKTPVVYISICSLAGSVSIMAIKGFGVAVKLTFAGNNQFTHLPTYIFGIVVAGCIAVQMNYFNKALDLFSTNVVNPIYYVFLTTATSLASIILFQGYGSTGGVNGVSLLCGFATIFVGVYLLNEREHKPLPLTGRDTAGMRTPARHSLLETRQSMSMAGRISMDEDDDGTHLPLSTPIRSHDRSGARRISTSNQLDEALTGLMSPTSGKKQTLLNGAGRTSSEVIFDEEDEFEGDAVRLHVEDIDEEAARRTRKPSR